MTYRALEDPDAIPDVPFRIPLALSPSSVCFRAIHLVYSSSSRKGCVHDLSLSCCADNCAAVEGEPSVCNVCLRWTQEPTMTSQIRFVCSTHLLSPLVAIRQQDVTLNFSDVHVEHVLYRSLVGPSIRTAGRAQPAASILTKSPRAP